MRPHFIRNPETYYLKSKLARTFLSSKHQHTRFAQRVLELPFGAAVDLNPVPRWRHPLEEGSCRLVDEVKNAQVSVETETGMFVLVLANDSNDDRGGRRVASIPICPGSDETPMTASLGTVMNVSLGDAANTPPCG